jgi:RTX calcium-binding nonapeptide repeat (4 copies)
MRSRLPRLARSVSGPLSLVGLAALAPLAPARTVGSDLGALEPTKTIGCPVGGSCDVAQALSGNGTPFSPPTGVIAGWSVKLGARAPEGMRLVVQEATGTAGAGQGRRTIDIGSLRAPRPNAVATFPERLPIHADEVFGVRLEAGARPGTSATIAAPFAGEYRTMLLWDPPLPFGDSYRLADRVFEDTRIALSVDVVPAAAGRCDPLNTYTGSRLGDDYGGFQHAGDVIYGKAGGDRLRAYSGADCLFGGGGRDRLAGMDGADLIVGGGGRDDIGAGEGNDRVLVRDGRRDAVRCAGGQDFVRADGLDRLSSCERIRRG